MESSKRYNSVPVKDNCALCLPTPVTGRQSLAYYMAYVLMVGHWSVS